MDTPRVWSQMLPEGTTTRESVRLDELLHRLSNNKVQLRPRYQRKIRWRKEKMDNLVLSIMQRGLIPELMLYVFAEDDEKDLETHEYECIDGQHRIFTLSHFLNSEPVVGLGKEFMITCPYKCEIAGKKETIHLFYKENEHTERYRLSNPGIYNYMTDKERLLFDRYTLSLQTIRKKLTLRERIEIFISLQQGVPVRNSDLLKNSSVRIPQFIQYEMEWEDRFNALVNTRSVVKADNYWVTWATRCFLISFPREGETASKSFAYMDSQIDKMILKENEPVLLNPTSEQEGIFAKNMERFMSFMESLPVGVRVSGTQFFSVYYYLSSAEDGREDILRGHIKGWFEKLPDEHKGAWRKSSIAPERRPVLFSDYCADLEALRVPFEEVERIKEERKKMPKQLREKVWRNKFGSRPVGSCECCEKRILITAWDCGHIQAHACGGSDLEENLLPVCKNCNTSMGILHMARFKERFYGKKLTNPLELAEGYEETSDDE